MKGSGSTRLANSRTKTAKAPDNPRADAISKVPKSSQRFLELVQSGQLDRMSDDDYRKEIDRIWDARKDRLSMGEGKYTAAEYDAITEYSRSFYDDINGQLNSGRLTAHNQEIVDRMDSAMKKVKLKTDTVVYRGSSVNETTAQKGYTSTSRDIYSANKFRKGKHLHSYLLPKGTNVIYIGEGGENELLLPRNFNLAKHKIK